MMTFDEALANDRAALELLTADVAVVPDDAMGLPTPCDGWTIRDLLDHMNTEHAAICGGEIDLAADPRAQFSLISERWLAFLAGRRGTTVRVPKMAADLPSERVLAVHFADMLIHRWDLAAALGLPCPTDPALIDAGFKVAHVMTDAASPLVGDGGVYQVALPPDERASALENLVRMYGRDHLFAGKHSSPALAQPPVENERRP